MHACMHTCMHIHTYVRPYACIHAYMHAHIYVCISCTYIRTRVETPRTNSTKLPGHGGGFRGSRITKICFSMTILGLPRFSALTRGWLIVWTPVQKSRTQYERGPKPDSENKFCKLVYIYTYIYIYIYTYIYHIYIYILGFSPPAPPPTSLSCTSIRMYITCMYYKRTAADIGAEVVEVRGDRVSTPTKIEVMREIKGLVIFHCRRHVQLIDQRAAQWMQILVALHTLSNLSHVICEMWSVRILVKKRRSVSATRIKDPFFVGSRILLGSRILVNKDPCCADRARERERMCVCVCVFVWKTD
jgi:hypothetical protein